MKYLLSKFIPLRFTSTYSMYTRAGEVEYSESEESSWWQWNDHIYSHKTRKI